jgi:hypothetical protein
LLEKTTAKSGFWLMPHFWMTYRDSGRSVGTVIMEAPSLIQAGLKAIRGVGDARRRPVAAVIIEAPTMFQAV